MALVTIGNSDSEEIKQAFEDLYEAMNAKTLREKEKVICAVCCLCRDHQQTGFIDVIKRGLYLSQELNTTTKGSPQKAALVDFNNYSALLREPLR